MKNIFTYCKGKCCAIKEHCVRYKEGLGLPEGNWWWMEDCSDNRPAYINEMK